MEVGTVVQPETAKDPGQVETGPQQAAPRGPREFTGQCQGFPHDGTNKRRRRFNRAEGMDRDHGLFPLFRLLQRQGEGDHITADERCTEARNKTLTGKSMVSLPHNQAKKKKKKKKQHAQGYETDPRRPSGSFFSCLIAFERFAHAALVWFEPFASPSQILESLSLVRSFVSDSAALFFAQVPFKRFAVFLRSSSPFGTLGGLSRALSNGSVLLLKFFLGPSIGPLLFLFSQILRSLSKVALLVVRV